MLGRYMMIAVEGLSQMPSVFVEWETSSRYTGLSTQLRRAYYYFNYRKPQSHCTTLQRIELYKMRVMQRTL